MALSFLASLVIFSLSHSMFIQQIRSAEVCCKLTGCFSDDAPFNNLPLPMCTGLPNNTPFFNLFTISNPYKSYPITPDHLPSNFSHWKSTYFLGHGWNGEGNSGWVIRMKDELLKKDDVNVVVINWQDFSNLANYFKAASNVRTVGAHLASVMKAIRDRRNNAYLYCIGHSLGAHLCAHAGLKIRIDRISGMDPAGPGFEKSPDIKIGLYPGSADFVDVMHTDKTYGTSRPIGHVDFYPNGGSNQPGCKTNSCSHTLAHSFFIESIKKDCFISIMQCSDFTEIPKSCKKCLDCGVMGYGADSSSTGLRYLKTSVKKPYCLSFAVLKDNVVFESNYRDQLASKH